MTIKELKEELDLLNIPSDILSTDREYPNEGFTIHFNGMRWETYYSERGIKTGLKEFNSEEEACENIHSELIAYASKVNEYKKPTEISKDERKRRIFIHGILDFLFGLFIRS